MIPDSGGAGRWRGGIGFARDYLILADEVRFSMRTDKHAIAPFGSDGGLAGAKGACIINPGQANEKRLPSRFGDYRLEKGTLLRLERPGGGGLGEPLERPPKSVLEDVRQGYVSLERAETDYGVVIKVTDGGPALDEAATQILRGEKQKNSGKRNAPLL
jgi:N-methylhydantoinase B